MAWRASVPLENSFLDLMLSNIDVIIVVQVAVTHVRCTG